jgi:hypothetical protein
MSLVITGIDQRRSINVNSGKEVNLTIGNVCAEFFSRAVGKVKKVVKEDQCSVRACVRRMNVCENAGYVLSNICVTWKSVRRKNILRFFGHLLLAVFHLSQGRALSERSF